ncbi:predicted protein [Uncinocarpus reesii 1704]|uniref:HMG box domain-containing protein n=1 Tax=Uncinocarpus reesii (strain UAMH 1704) TaxID=336963 RepID=C4JRM2_UNCRE|nr:uncharacterized protein UREG_05111 [Uncinocarpus reesii 1704]EEP80269.1 predicted protein [Uncinocarpus reesii 1704]
MSYDRVLPRPIGLCYDVSGRDLPIRSADSLLDHRFPGSTLIRSSFEKYDYPSVPLQVKPLAAGSARNSISEPEMGCQKSLVTETPAVSQPQIGRKRVASIAASDLRREERAASASSSKSTSSRDSGVQFCLCQPDPKIPRPRNAFILFRQHFQAAVVAQNPGLANPDISKIIGKKWKSLSLESQRDWKNLAEEEKARHQQQYPGYRYQPRRPGRKGSTVGGGINNNPTGASVCNRCGGRIMNPPSTPTTPFAPAMQTQDDSCVPPQANGQRYGSLDGRFPRKETRSLSPIHVNPNCEWGATFQPQYRDGSGLLSPGIKRRQSTHIPARRNLSPGEAYSPRNASFTRPAPLQPRNALGMDPSRPYGMASLSEPVHGSSLTLPPLQTLAASQQNHQKEVENMVMTIPIVNKIKVLSKISPPFTTTKAANPGRGAVIAVEGQDVGSVRSILQYLKGVLSSKRGQDVRVFEGPDLSSPTSLAKLENSRDATVQYLETISAWHKISEEIVDYINGSGSPPDRELDRDKLEAEVSPKSLGPYAARMGTRRLGSPISAPTDSTFRIALVPQYQLSTADAHACATPINDAYAPIDHWQWMASLWRGCVGPDITVHIRSCYKEELAEFGEGNPVEIRLDDARALVVRRLSGSPGSIEEKALRRIGFEVEEFLRK